MTCKVCDLVVWSSVRVSNLLTTHQGENGTLATSGVIVLSRQTYADAASACQALGEQLWAPDHQTNSIQRTLDYLVYQKKVTADSTFWVASQGVNFRAIDGRGHVEMVDPTLKLPVLCTQTAPFSYADRQDTSEKWRVSVNANNEELVGYGQMPSE